MVVTDLYYKTEHCIGGHLDLGTNTKRSSITNWNDNDGTILTMHVDITIGTEIEEEGIPKKGQSIFFSCHWNN